jgi:hypothetical protein
MSTPEREAPPVSEEIHMPEPTFLPFWTAVGITLAIVGLTVFFPVLSIVGVVVTVGCVVRWIRHTRRDISELPPEHH